MNIYRGQLPSGARTAMQGNAVRRNTVQVNTKQAEAVPSRKPSCRVEMKRNQKYASSPAGQ